MAICAAVDDLIEGALCSAVTLLGKNNTPESVCGSDPDAIDLDRLQYSEGIGPTAEAARNATIVRIDDLSVDARWPSLRGAGRADRPITSAVTFPLYTTELRLGTLTLYSDRVHAFSHEDVEGGEAFATHAALTLDAARRLEQFQRALASRDVIGQAKGILMERFDLEATEAFRLISKMSQDRNTPVGELARSIIDLGHPEP